MVITAFLKGESGILGRRFYTEVFHIHRIWLLLLSSLSQEKNAGSFQNMWNCTVTVPYALSLATILSKIRISIVYKILVFLKFLLYFSWNKKFDLNLEMSDPPISYIYYFSSHDGKGMVPDHAIMKAPLHKAVAIMWQSFEYKAPKDAARCLLPGSSPPDTRRFCLRHVEPWSGREIVRLHCTRHRST